MFTNKFGGYVIHILQLSISPKPINNRIHLVMFTHRDAATGHLLQLALCRSEGLVTIISWFFRAAI